MLASIKLISTTNHTNQHEQRLDVGVHVRDVRVVRGKKMDSMIYY